MINLISVCENANRIGISGHIHPDGDCVASTMALWQFLTKVFPDRQIDVRLEIPPESCRFVKGVSQIVRNKKKIHYDVFIVSDSVPDEDRIGTAYPYFADASVTVNIDHHITNQGVGTYCYVDAGASSASELVADLIFFADPHGRYMDEELAKTLYFGIIQDCGVFQYSNTSPKTMRMAARLLEYGFDFPQLIDETFYEKTYVQSKLLGYALNKCELALDNKVCYVVITKEEMKNLKVDTGDFEGIANQLRYIRGVDVAALLRSDKGNGYKLSLRSQKLVDVAAVCSAFGGGGHIRAAGATIPGEADVIMEQVLAQIQKQL